MGVAWLLGAGAAVRLGLVAYASWHDSAAELRYTDIDYLVLADGGALLASGRSPFGRPAFRYSPLLALPLVPDAWGAGSAGKLFFCAADLAVATLLHAVLRARGVSTAVADRCAAAWLFHPVVVAISTRGSHDALVAVPALAALLAHAHAHISAAAALLALAAHLKLYPLIFVPAFLLSINGHHPASRAGATPQPPQPARSTSLRDAILRLERSQRSFVPLPFNRMALLRLRFAFIFALIYALLFGACTAWCGQDYARQAVFFHLFRTDARHNFSAYFYPTLLATRSGDDGPVGRMVDAVLALAPLFISAMLLLLITVRFADDLPFCMLASTLAFVTFNKVCTAQYFVWYLSLLPLALPSTLALEMRSWCACGALCAMWWGSCATWLWLAYQLEYTGTAGYMPVWLASLGFLGANCAVLVALIHWHVPTPFFWRGRLATQACIRARGREAELQLVRQWMASAASAAVPSNKLRRAMLVGASQPRFDRLGRARPWWR